MKLQTYIPVQKKNENLIDYQSKLFLLGSCFVENIGEKLKYFKFQSLQNPFGVLFNPKAIETLVYRAIHGVGYEEIDVFQFNGLWHCLDAHSQWSDSSKEVLLNNLNAQLDLTKQQLSSATHIVITLGTAWVYKFLASNNVVANCHKLPSKNFSKELLSIKKIVVALQNIQNNVMAVNPDAVFIFTVSPVRHLKDGFVENTRSKAHLIAGLHDFISLSAKGNFYFPSYEIMMDELRDYRFYNEDMIHPNSTAINYIWEKFKTVWLSESTFATMDAVDSIQKRLTHRSFHPDSEDHKRFLDQLDLDKVALQQRMPDISFS